MYRVNIWLTLLLCVLVLAGRAAAHNGADDHNDKDDDGGQKRRPGLPLVAPASQSLPCIDPAKACPARKKKRMLI